ncbi:hypothetical protein FHS96_003991 [Sphingomonas zeicaulis]
MLVDRFQRLVPAPEGCDNLIRIGVPYQRFPFVIMLIDDTVIGGLEIDDGAEGSALKAPAGQLG